MTGQGKQGREPIEAGDGKPVRDAGTLERESPLIDSIRSTDWGEAADRARDVARASGSRMERQGMLPPTRIADRQGQPGDVLSNPNASAQEKLRVVEALARQGVGRVTITDADGTVRDCRLEIEQSGSKTLVHMYATDDAGRERVVLRGISNGDGSYSPESDGRGRQVGFHGTWWSKNMAGRSALAEGGAGDVTRSSFERDAARPDYAQRYRPDRLPPEPYGPRGEFRERPPREQLPMDYGPMQPGELGAWNDYFDQMSQYSSQRRGRMQQLPTGAVYFNAGMAIDADGAPDARRIDPTGQTKTSLRYEDGSSVNAHHIPYFVLPLKGYQQFGVKKGDIAAVRYNGRVEFAVFADVGPQHKLGEGSMALARQLGINPNPRSGGVGSGVEYIVFPRSGDGTPQTPDQIRDKGSYLLARHADYLNRGRV